MRNWLLKIRPSRAVLGKMAWVGCLVGVAALAYFWGRHGALSRAEATPAQGVPNLATQGYGQRIVAYIYKNIPVTREELGEYLIARFGADRADFLINQRIIQVECQKRRIQITDAEVNAQLAEDLKMFGNISEKDFVNQILKRYNKSLFEWKEDVIRPKLALTRLVKDSVIVTEDDLRKGFEAKYGPKVKCRMIVFPKEAKGQLLNDRWVKLCKSDKDFNDEASKQFISGLAAKGGEIPPIHRHFPDSRIEEVAFSLAPGQVSTLFDLPDGTLGVLKCVQHIAAENTKLEANRTTLHREIYEQKLAQAIPQRFAEFRQEAAPQNYLNTNVTSAENDRKLRQDAGLPPTDGIRPPGN